ncbi:hypothetical protein Hanom_Chr00s091794g01799361 [Helianthus anomalus]
MLWLLNSSFIEWGINSCNLTAHKPRFEEQNSGIFFNTKGMLVILHGVNGEN